MPQAPVNNPIGSPFIELQSVDSTNNYARRLIEAASLPGSQSAVEHGTSIFAHEQTAGKGQRGKTWLSEKEGGIALSIILKPPSQLYGRQFQLISCVSVALHSFFSKYAGEETRIKWPNDLYWRNRKAGGVLIESGLGSLESDGTLARRSATKSETPEDRPTGYSPMPEWKWAIVGIGININQSGFPGWLPNPVSLKQITGREFEPVALAKEFCDQLNRYYSELISGGFERIFNSYNSILYKRNEWVKLKKTNRSFETRIMGVGPSGKLITQHATREEFEFGDVEWPDG